MSVEAREDRLEQLQESYREQLAALRGHIAHAPEEEAGQCLEDAHAAGVRWFNAFERTLDEYSMPGLELSQDMIVRKAEDAVGIVTVIINHWSTVRAVCAKYGIAPPVPSETAYASIQRVIKRFEPDDKVESMKERFREAGLPVSGFESKTKHSGWNKKNYLAVQMIVGVPMLIAAGWLIFNYQNLTGMQYLFTRILTTTAITLIGASTIEGTVNVNWSMKQSLVIRATGWIAIFILLYFVNPPAV